MLITNGTAAATEPMPADGGAGPDEKAASLGIDSGWIAHKGFPVDGLRGIGRREKRKTGEV
jgi:hypothetical protein